MKQRLRLALIALAGVAACGSGGDDGGGGQTLLTATFDVLGGVVVFAMFPDPDAPSSPTFRDAQGTVEFDAYDPPARVSGAFDATVLGFVQDDPPRYHITGTFDCAE